jgi:hypothetical protein
MIDYRLCRVCVMSPECQSEADRLKAINEELKAWGAELADPGRQVTQTERDAFFALLKRHQAAVDAHLERCGGQG